VGGVGGASGGGKPEGNPTVNAPLTSFAAAAFRSSELCGRDRIRTCVGNAGDLQVAAPAPPGSHCIPTRAKLSPMKRRSACSRDGPVQGCSVDAFAAGHEGIDVCLVWSWSSKYSPWRTRRRSGDLTRRPTPPTSVCPIKMHRRMAARGAVGSAPRPVPAKRHPAPRRGPTEHRPHSKAPATRHDGVDPEAGGNNNHAEDDPEDHPKDHPIGSHCDAASCPPRRTATGR
jgi:hypothetical protein